MTKEAHDVVKSILNDISKDESISRTDRVKALLDIEEITSNIDENLISKEEGLGLRIDSLKSIAKLTFQG